MDWGKLLSDLLYLIITTVVPVITVYLVKYLNSKFTQIRLATEETAVSNTVNSVLDLIINAVTATSQTYVDTLKAAGSFTEEAKIEAYSRTKETVLKLMNEESKEIIQSLYGDIDEWLGIQIEAAVKNLK